MSSPGYNPLPQAVIGWTKGTGFAVHTFPGCPVAQRTKHVTPEILDLLGRAIDAHACKACKRRGWTPAKESTIEQAAQVMGDKASGANYSEGAASRMHQAYRAALTRDLGKFSQPPTSILATQVSTSVQAADDRMAAALAMTPDRSDREQINRARHACAEEARLARETIETLAPSATIERGLGELKAAVHRLDLLLSRLAELKAMRERLDARADVAQLQAISDLAAGSAEEVRRG
jgi:hypothetical protein